MKFIHISDPHLSADYTGQNIMLLHAKTGITPTEQFAIGMEHINKHHPDAEFFLLTGDIVQDGTLAEYTRFRGYIDSFFNGKPCYAIPGNHDSTDFWEGWFGSGSSINGDYIIREEKSGLRIIALDSRGGPYGSGVLRNNQLAWLGSQVSPDEPAIIIMHHTPHIGGNEYLTYQMQASKEFFGAVRGRGVLGIFAGHTHICFESLLGEIPCHTAASIAFELITDEHSMTASDNTGYNVCIFENGAVTVDNVSLPGSGANAKLFFD